MIKISINLDERTGRLSSSKDSEKALMVLLAQKAEK